MKYLVVLASLLLAMPLIGRAAPIVRVTLRVEPATHSFTCRYTLTLPAADTASVIALNVSRDFRIDHMASPGAAAQRLSRVFYPYFADTLQRVVWRYATPARRRKREVSVTYAGTLGKPYFTEQGMVFSGHTNWLPFRPYREYEAVEYELEVAAPGPYHVLSTTQVQRQGGGKWFFRGRASAIEITAMVGRQFQQLTSGSAPLIRLAKTGPTLSRVDTVLLRKAEGIVAFYNRTIGRQDPISHFTIFLPGTNSDAFGVLDNATVITYTDFDVAADREALLILAHEISHKWWGYGGVHDYNDWLNEAFATYSSLLYLRENGDEAGYRAELAKRAATVGDAPPIRGFDYQRYPRPMYRRVVYNKGTVVLAALHERLGTAQFVHLLAIVAARHVSTTDALLEVVAQTSGPATRDWLLAELSR
ncbi:hypothetical protein MUN81_18225 [Hymenobacter sp. 5317J-9]|uniref:M1 family aminopeptidase n=1 Tax=Hymenobacter sp. 5317J-9 TaxID=2932250 RepID=UPI001FD69A1B|nr:M1 family aminopeptidase [Hymenobacter sp. 5317J-9]UOQ97164.1 hypothetical protein MUN81_18225 [Hymenobacter sp. 5317J-9]